MIQIKSASQFARAGERLRTERQAIRRHEPGLWMVTNLAKNNGYSVRIERNELGTFGTCSCAAGTPKNRRGQPQVCKHLAAVVMYLRGLRAMRKRANS
jgi:uncharacterized Zn finger protein